MDSNEFNKIAAGVLAALLVIVGSKVFIHEVMHQKAPKKPGIVIATADTGSKTGGSETKEDGPSFMTLLASADAGAGAKEAKKCKACHEFKKGGKNKSGPVLYGVVNRNVASVASFANKYTPALKKRSSEKWSFENLNAFLTAPQKWAKGTGMRVKVKKNKGRANLIGYLNSLSDSPAPLPSGS